LRKKEVSRKTPGLGKDHYQRQRAKLWEKRTSGKGKNNQMAVGTVATERITKEEAR